MKKLLLLAAATCALLAPAQAQEAEYTPEFDTQIRAWVERNPEVVLQTINNFIQSQQEEQQRASDESVLALSAELVSSEASMVIGNPDGAVEMVYFLDAACGFCHRMSPVIDEVIAANPDLKIVQRWVPFLTPASTYAGVLGDIINKEAPRAYYPFYKNVMATEGQLTDALVDDAARQALGERADDILALAASGPARDAGASTVEHNMNLAQRAAVQGTPFFMVVGAGSDGIMRGAVDATQLNAAVEKGRSAE